MLKLTDFAKRYNLNARTVRRWVKIGAIDIVKIGGLIYIPTDEIERIESEGLSIKIGNNNTKDN